MSPPPLGRYHFFLRGGTTLEGLAALDGGVNIIRWLGDGMAGPGERNATVLLVMRDRFG
jgi:hypothetical protein